VTQVYAYAGETDSALAWLIRAVAQDEGGLSEQFDQPFFIPVHDGARWGRFPQLTGTTDTQLAAIRFKLALPE